jgi:hypothetical protein
MQEGVSSSSNNFKITYWSRKLRKTMVSKWDSKCESDAIMEFSNEDRLILKIDKSKSLDKVK